jgi:hypothetical protein
MPVLDRLTFKNPLLLWLQRCGCVKLEPPLLGIVRRLFLDRKRIWEEGAGIEGDRATLVDRFLQVAHDNEEKSEITPEQQALGMVLAGSETT